MTCPTCTARYLPATAADREGALEALTAAGDRLREARARFAATAGDHEFRLLCDAAVSVDRARRRLNAIERELSEASV